MRSWIAVECFKQVTTGMDHKVLEACGHAIGVRRVSTDAAMTDRAPHLSVRVQSQGFFKRNRLPTLGYLQFAALVVKIIHVAN
jgi:hypothetical protein